MSGRLKNASLIWINECMTSQAMVSGMHAIIVSSLAPLACHNLFSAAQLVQKCIAGVYQVIASEEEVLALTALMSKTLYIVPIFNTTNMWPNPFELFLPLASCSSTKAIQVELIQQS